MPLQNRVTPDAQIVAEPWRGTMMGNRGGRIHDVAKKRLLKRMWTSKRWICCVLEFKKRQRQVMGNSYTELFFLDEVSALAAGHRPCFECRRKAANQFADFWAQAHGTFSASRADEMDVVMHRERTGVKPMISATELSNLPEGTMVQALEQIFALRSGSLLLWSGQGYTKTEIEPVALQLLTPPSVIEVLKLGYCPNWHESAR